MALILSVSKPDYTTNKGNRSLPPERNGFPLYMIATVREFVAREAVPR